MDKEFRKKIRTAQKNYAARPDSYDKAGEILLKKAEQAHEDKNKASDKDMDNFYYDVASGMVGLAHQRAFILNPWPGERKKVVCHNCGGSSGTYHYMKDGTWWGSCCKSQYGIQKEELQKERETVCH